ncbi:MAG TPA: Rieske 2Fe-2S domain-containing protein [Burkholderiales bacterium]|nr:Rieske 2Fe-2S domain-containing protein [Burkholderiales bacterium]
MTTSTCWAYAIDEDALEEGHGTTVHINGNAIALFRVEDQFFAIANACPHRGGPLGSGDVEGFTVTCPWHGWCWDMRTGHNTRQPNSAVACFDVKVEDGRVFVHVDEAASGSSG